MKNIAMAIIKSNILVIEDDPISQLFLKKLLEKEGYKVDVANEATEGISKAGLSNYQFAFVDLVLPGMMNGVDVIKKLRVIMPNSKIIAYSGFNDVDITERVTHAGANSFLSKPFNKKQLIDVMFVKN